MSQLLFTIYSNKTLLLLPEKKNFELIRYRETSIVVKIQSVVIVVIRR